MGRDSYKSSCKNEVGGDGKTLSRFLLEGVIYAIGIDEA
jgi:hypothetical protein